MHGHLVHDDELQRHGLRRYADETGRRLLAIAASNRYLSEFLAETSFSNYQEVLRRHPFIVRKTHPVRIAKRLQRAILLDWEKIEQAYDEKSEPSYEPGTFPFDA